MTMLPLDCVSLKRLICFCFLALCIQLCYSAEGWAHPQRFEMSELRLEPRVKLTIQLSGVRDLADVLSFRDLLQASSLVSEVRPERLVWAAGHPEQGRADWSVQLSTDNPDALEEELLSQARTQQLGGDDLRLIVRQSRLGLIEFTLETVPAAASAPAFLLPEPQVHSRVLCSGRGFD